MEIVLCGWDVDFRIEFQIERVRYNLKAEHGIFD